MQLHNELITTIDGLLTPLTPHSKITEYRNYLAQIRNLLQGFFHNNSYEVGQLVCVHARAIDRLLTHLLQHRLTIVQPLALIAVGGYGRGELHPNSDIDLLFLHQQELTDAEQDQLENFITLLWDLRLELGQSVRTLSECVSSAMEDVTVITNLLESRLITGDSDLFNQLQQAISPKKIWPCDKFYRSKLNEQIERHKRFNNTAYNLEPNIKEGPGGLRDIHMIGWVAKRHFGAQTLADLISHNFLTAEEYNSLVHGEQFLWRIRFALHSITDRHEDRMLFDYQRTIAKMFGYEDNNNRLAVEQFTKDYFRTVHELERLNEMLLQLFHENILLPKTESKSEQSTTAINRRFRIRNKFLEISHPAVFQFAPFSILELFLILVQHPKIKGVRAETIRALRNHLYLIDDAFRNDIRCRSLFMEILRQQQGITHIFHKMHRYGVLGRYLPAFDQISGQMQHDLFHAYTVDEHSLRLLRNLRRMTIAKHQSELPLCSEVMKQVPKQELLYIAALFHDIAKGRGGDHSELGAVDARDFCERHMLSSFDTNLVSWLVQSHLQLSLTAQRKDISDPEVIHNFALFVGRQDRLDYLYLLTVADIRATSPTIWNGWKASLINELYVKTSQALSRGLTDPVSQQELCQQRISEVTTILTEQHDIAEVRIAELIREVGDAYLLRYSTDEVVWHFISMLQSNINSTITISGGEQTDEVSGIRINDNQQPDNANATGYAANIVAIRNNSQRGGSQIFIHTALRNHLFANVTATLMQLGLNIVDARIMASQNGYTLDSYMVLNHKNQPIDTQESIVVQQSLEAMLQTEISNSIPDKSSIRPLPRTLKCFTTPTLVQFRDNTDQNHTIMEVVTTDRSGLLSQIASVITQQKLRLHSARITTLGERVEDLFSITNVDGEMLHPSQQQQLHTAIATALDNTPLAVEA